MDLGIGKGKGEIQGSFTAFRMTAKNEQRINKQHPKRATAETNNSQTSNGRNKQ
jgi:hypothetical protein